jgi:uncharacterized protein
MPTTAARHFIDLFARSPPTFSQLFTPERVMTSSTLELNNVLTPVRSKVRIETLDLIRGVSILGILAVNADGFASPITASLRPAMWPFPNEGWTAIAYWIMDAFFHDKFVSLFSMLFGVSLFLVGGERSDRQRGAILRRRLFVLLMFAMFHGFGIWWGDILALYACTGFIMYFCRSWQPKTLMIVGVLLYASMTCRHLPYTAIPFASSNATSYGVAKMDPDTTTIARRKAEVASEIAKAGESWAGAYRLNAKEYLHQIRIVPFLIPSTLGLMMTGLALFKMNFLKGKSSTRSYAFAVAAGVLALSASSALAWRSDIIEQPLLITGAAQQLLAPIVAIGYASLLILLLRAGASTFTAPFAAAGRMAFTNYLSQSLIMTSIFYGGRGGMMGKVDRPALAVIVLAVWILQIMWSIWWLSRFEMGPFEWIWRSLTYGYRVPMAKQS